jgi:hypothetical protein
MNVQLNLADGRSFQYDSSQLREEYRIDNNDGTIELKLTNCAPFIVKKGTAAKRTRRKLVDRYTITVDREQDVTRKVACEEQFIRQIPLILNGLRQTHPYLDASIDLIESEDNTETTANSYWALTLFGDVKDPDTKYYISQGLAGGITRETIISFLEVSTVSNMPNNPWFGHPGSNPYKTTLPVVTEMIAGTPRFSDFDEKIDKIINKLKRK